MYLTPEIIENAINRFIGWLDTYGELSQDRMDYWSSSFGRYSRRLFYRNRILGVIPAIWGLIVENYIPQLQKYYANPRREAIADAHYAQAFMSLYEIYNDNRYLNRAEKFLKHLISASCTGYSGYCWGYNFGWETPTGYLRAGVPFITVTPYGFWAFRKHYQITNQSESRDICLSVLKFAMNDLNKITKNGYTCTSYSPEDNNLVINANTYRAAMLLQGYAMFKNEQYKDEALINIDFVLKTQQEDGSWFYSMESDQKSFIDNFHTCLVLRNLCYCYQVLNDQTLLSSILNGYKYYRNKLIKKEFKPKHFSKSKYFKLRKYELYDFAEGINVGCLIKPYISDAFNLSAELALQVINKFQLADGHFVTRVSTPGIRHKVPYHRWPQSQLFNALTNLLKVIK